ncbi:hypothetical protein V6N13_133349 [Hibiscus sabdariffa]
MVDSESEWRWSEFDGALSTNILLHIASVKPPLNSLGVDGLGWREEPLRMFLVKSSYEDRVRCLDDVVDKGWGLIHRFKGSPRTVDYEGVLLRCRCLVREVVETMVLATPTSTVASVDQCVPDRVLCWAPSTEWNPPAPSQQGWQCQLVLE